MTDWEIKQPIDYSANGDDIDSFSQKTKATFEQIFDLLNRLRANGATAGLDATDATAYSLRINTNDNCLYMRDGANEKWILLGELDTYLGIKPELISAIRNGGGLGKISVGTDALKPTTDNATYDLYVAQDTSRVYIWTGSSWRIILSLNFGDTLNYEKYCVSRAEIGYSGADKILRLDSQTGKANVDITGSPEKLLNYFIDVQELKDGDALVFNAEKEKFVNLPNSGWIDNIRVESEDREDGSILVYREQSNMFHYESKGVIGSGRSLIFKRGTETLAEYNGDELVTIEVNTLLTSAKVPYVNHLLRLIENLYLTLEVAGLNPGGYDGLISVAFNGDLRDIDTTKSTAAIDGKISGTNVELVTKPLKFIDGATSAQTPMSRAHLMVKHQLTAVDNIKAFISFKSSLTAADKFILMDRHAIYPDKNNASRASTEFIYQAPNDESKGSIATLKIVGTSGGTPIVIDSFACVFDE